MKAHRTIIQEETLQLRCIAVEVPTPRAIVKIVDYNPSLHTHSQPADRPNSLKFEGWVKISYLSLALSKYPREVTAICMILPEVTEI